jgi:hypothetical protein
LSAEVEMQSLVVHAVVLPLALLLTSSSSRPPQDPAERLRAGCAGSPASPDGVFLTIRTADGRTRFGQNEIVRLDMAFSGRAAGLHALNLATYDRSGRLGIDRVCIDPADGTVDPLGDYYASFGFVGGGLSGGRNLAPDPFVLQLDVNEWHRFVRPGRYRMQVRSGRVGPPPFGGPTHEREAVTSNWLEVEIVPPGPPLTEAELAAASARVLRFLDTREAAVEMARRLLYSQAEAHRVGAEAFECRFGLYASPHRSFILGKMEHMLANATATVNPGFVQTLATLSAMIEHPARTGDFMARFRAMKDAELRYGELAREAQRRAAGEKRER